MKKIEVMHDVLSANDYVAKQNKEFFQNKGSMVINIMSSPGSGKTSFIVETIKQLNDLDILVIEGDVEGDVDAQTIEKTGKKAVQINTSGACHLDASMIHQAVSTFQDTKLDLVMIENVGNLICTTSYDLGEDYKIAILSTPEGEDKPLKYPRMFQIADLLIINKIDMMEASGFNLERFKYIINKINPKLEYIQISCRTGDGLKNWTDWIKGKMNVENKN